MEHYVIICLIVLLASLACAASGSSWTAVPFDKWAEAPTLDPCAEGLTPEGVNLGDQRTPPALPEPPYGAWKESTGRLVAAGIAPCWSTMLMPGDQREVTVSLRFTVRKSSETARQLPGGCVRWGFHWGENLPGWDVGVVLGYQDPLSFYRVQLSASRGELALWDATGGFLQLIPCPVEIGKPHNLTVTWRGAHLIALLDDKKVMDYWDRSLPYTQGQVGLAVWQSNVRFEDVAVTPALGRAEKMSAHVPAFRLAPTDNILHGHPSFRIEAYPGMILFDGHEPICYFFKQASDKGDEYTRDTLLHEAVKLKPGWRPAYYNYIGPNGLEWTWRWALLVGDLPDAFKITKSGKQLVFDFQTETPGKGRTDYTCTVSFDQARGVYRYEFRGTLKMIATAEVNEFELSDPLTYNNRAPGPEVVYRWNPAGHRWWVYQGTSGAWERMPLTDYPNDYSTDINNAKMQWGKVADFLYPDPAACPLFETELKWRPGIYSAGQCSWGYDYHHRELNAGTIGAGEERSFVMTFSALPPAEAERIFAQSNLMPCLENEERTIIPFVPTGNSFVDTTTWQDPSATMAWIGGTRDETTGHGDCCSLRLDGPGKTSVRVYHYMIEPYAKRWWIRGWYKTKDLEGAGLALRVGYFDPPPQVRDDFNLGTGTRDWTYFSVITDVFGYRDITDLIFEVEGEGQAWIDDIAVSALTEEERPQTTGVVDSVVETPEMASPEQRSARPLGPAGTCATISSWPPGG